MPKVRIDFLLDQEDKEFLEKLSEDLSTHLRNAVKEYIAKLTPQAKTSPSKKGGK